jgi:hypothetical protein
MSVHPDQISPATTVVPQNVDPQHRRGEEVEVER